MGIWKSVIAKMIASRKVQDRAQWRQSERQEGYEYTTCYSPFALYVMPYIWWCHRDPNGCSRLAHSSSVSSSASMPYIRWCHRDPNGCSRWCHDWKPLQSAKGLLSGRIRLTRAMGVVTGQHSSHWEVLTGLWTSIGGHTIKVGSTKLALVTNCVSCTPETRACLCVTIPCYSWIDVTVALWAGSTRTGVRACNLPQEKMQEHTKKNTASGEIHRWSFWKCFVSRDCLWSAMICHRPQLLGVAG